MPEERWWGFLGSLPGATVPEGLLSPSQAVLCQRLLMEVTLQLPQQDSSGNSSHWAEAVLCFCPPPQILTAWG